MFENLRKKFIFINMGLLTFVFLAIFGSIFISTYISLEKDINRQLIEAIDFMEFNVPKKPNDISIIVEMDKLKNILKISKSVYTDIDDEKLKSTLEKIIESKRENGKIKISQTNYSYLLKNTIYGYKIAFVDRTVNQTLLNGLLKSFVGVGVISLIFLFVISIYLTNKSIHPIEETFNKQREFIQNASHELKTPLTIIKTDVSLVLSNKEDTILNQRKWIDSINSQTDRMSELIGEMLSLAKLDMDDNIEFTKLNVSKLIESIILEFEALLFEKNILLNTNIQKNITINGDRESLKKLFSILMDNAIKHSYDSLNKQISVNLYVDKNKLKFSITNTGYGIDSKYLDKIFERFFRIDSSRERKTGGYGLGLSIAKMICEKHRGKIYATSNVGVDTTFIVELPI
jgi:signal transduction histidine kinase